jgi:hypothetical protein
MRSRTELMFQVVIVSRIGYQASAALAACNWRSLAMRSSANGDEHVWRST